MLLLLGILKNNKKYYMNVVDTEKDNAADDYQYINLYTLSNCANIRIGTFLSINQDPTEYIHGDFDVSRLIVDQDKLPNRMEDFQILEVYYNDDNKPGLYKTIDRAGNIKMHDISEFEYAKKKSIFGDDINNIPEFVLRRPITEAYEYLKNKFNEQDLSSIPVGLAKKYLTLIKGFKEGAHTVTKINNWVEIDVHEHLLFNGSASVKLIEYIPKERRVYLTKQDSLASPYPKERTLAFLPSSIILLGSNRLMTAYCRVGVNTEFSFYNSKVVKLSIPFGSDTLALYDKYVKSKDVHVMWNLDSNNNLTKDIYQNILPCEIFKLPKRFYQEMKLLPYTLSQSFKLEKENINIEMWIFTVSLLICWQYYNQEFKKRLKPIIENYQNIYQHALNDLVLDLGPKDALKVMNWTKKHLKEEMKKISNSDINVVDDFNCIFSFCQNNYDLEEELRIYSEETISIYGGLDKLKEDFSNKGKRSFVIKTLENIEKDLREESDNVEINSNVKESLKSLIKVETKPI